MTKCYQNLQSYKPPPRKFPNASLPFYVPYQIPRADIDNAF
jgi:hypothetical protein